MFTIQLRDNGLPTYNFIISFGAAAEDIFIFWYCDD